MLGATVMAPEVGEGGPEVGCRCLLQQSLGCNGKKTGTYFLWLLFRGRCLCTRVWRRLEATRTGHAATAGPSLEREPSSTGGNRGLCSLQGHYRVHVPLL
jgi:hypothetical protein